jgi:hypothetical protein
LTTTGLNINNATRPGYVYESSNYYHFKSNMSNYALFSQSTFLTASNLALGDRRDPDGSEVHHDADDSQNPDTLAVVGAIVAEDDCTDNTAKVTGSTNEARHDTVGKRMNMWDEGEVGTVSSVHEQLHRM